MTPRKDAERFDRAAQLLERAMAEIHTPFTPAQRVCFALAAFAAMGLDTSELEGIVAGAADGGDAAWSPLFAWVVATRATPMARKARMRSALSAAHDVLVKAPSRTRAVNRVLGLGRGRDIPEPLAAAREAAACLDAVVASLPEEQRITTRLFLAFVAPPRAFAAEPFVQLVRVTLRPDRFDRVALDALERVVRHPRLDEGVDVLPALVAAAEWGVQNTRVPASVARAVVAKRLYQAAEVNAALTDLALLAYTTPRALRAQLLAALPPFTLRGLVDGD